MNEDGLQALRAAGVGIVDRVATAAGLAPHALVAELSAFGSESTTSRIESVRLPDVIEAWLGAQLATLNITTSCFLSDGGEWLRLAPPVDAGWLARWWRVKLRPDSILLLSGDGERLLYVMHMYNGELGAVATATADILAMRVDRARLDGALAALSGALRVPMPPSPRAVLAAELFDAPHAFTLPAASSRERLDAWICDAFERWRELPPRLDGRWNEYIGPYVFSLAGTAMLATFGAWLQSSAEVAALWHGAGGTRLAICDGDFSRALALSRESDRYVARITHLAR